MRSRSRFQVCGSMATRALPAAQDDESKIGLRAWQPTLGADGPVAAEHIEIDPSVRPGKHTLQRLGGVALGQRFDLGAPLRCASPAFGRAQIDERTATDGAAGRRISNDEAVAGRRR